MMMLHISFNTQSTFALTFWQKNSVLTLASEEYAVEKSCEGYS